MLTPLDDSGVTEDMKMTWRDLHGSHHSDPVVVHKWAKYGVPYKARTSKHEEEIPITPSPRLTQVLSPKSTKTSSQTTSYFLEYLSSSDTSKSSSSSEDDSDMSSIQDDGEEWNGFLGEKYDYSGRVQLQDASRGLYPTRPSSVSRVGG